LFSISEQLGRGKWRQSAAEERWPVGWKIGVSSLESGFMEVISREATEMLGDMMGFRTSPIILQ
jgi:hypothetical protein